jgi:hypothetical protein
MKCSSVTVRIKRSLPVVMKAEDLDTAQQQEQHTGEQDLQ